MNITDFYLTDFTDFTATTLNVTITFHFTSDRLLRRTTLAQMGMPVCCGTALRNCGVRTVMDRVLDCLPNPSERHHPLVDFYEKLLCALVFKTSHSKRRAAADVRTYLQE
uniref:Uncharacterized protein n=1 Tax=Plectus sambesii TaxID=2011161 RepID=A0A914WGK7_9BILA